MIIKRSQSEVKKNTQKSSEQPKKVQEDIVLTPSEVSKPVKEEVQVPLSFEDIVFDSRMERRQGSRRRGYRRIDDRNIVSRAQEEANSIREQAVKEGHKLGLENAHAEIQALTDAIQEFFTYKDEMFAVVAPHILDISVEIAKKIINKEIEQDKTALLSLIKSAMGDSFKVSNHITVKVLPQDVVAVKEGLPEFLSINSEDVDIKVVPDDNISTGGAIIVTDNGIIDATIDTGLTILEQAFKNLQQQG